MDNPAIVIDFKPAHSHEQLMAKMESARRNFLEEAHQRWKLSEAAVAILSRKRWEGADSLAREAKNCVIALSGPRPLDEAISSAGGIRWSELDPNLMVKKQPGIFVAGEMIDWEAPTGGYLMQGCFATGTRAAKGAVDWIRKGAGSTA
jgi:predicted flavoprotein YhiN